MAVLHRLPAGAAFCVCATTIVAVSLRAQADIAQLQAAADNTLYEIVDGTLSNGQGGYLFAGVTASNSLRRGLIQFDLSSIPHDAVITNVGLTMHVSRSISLFQNFMLQRVTASWGEADSLALGEGGQGAHSKTGDATWIHRYFSTVNWQNAGGDFSDTVSATTVINGNGFYTWTSDVMTQDAQGWLANPSGNFGWIIRGDEQIPANAKRFDSRESADSTLRPSLLIEYHVVPAPAAWAVCGMALAGISRRRR